MTAVMCVGFVSDKDYVADKETTAEFQTATIAPQAIV